MANEAVIPRCTHIKTNGTQCGSPALRGRRFCFFHKNWQGQRIQLNAQPPTKPVTVTLPVLEDADSIQVALMQVMRLILSGQIDPRMAGLLLYALQTASINLRQLTLDPAQRERAQEKDARAAKAQAAAKAASEEQEDGYALAKYLLDSVGLLPIAPEKFEELSARGADEEDLATLRKFVGTSPPQAGVPSVDVEPGP